MATIPLLTSEDTQERLFRILQTPVAFCAGKSSQQSKKIISNPKRWRNGLKSPRAGAWNLRFARFLPLFGLFLSNTVHAQIAPGPLSPAHADLSGIVGCASCHGLLRRGLKCLDCHGEIKRRVEAGKGLHARANQSSSGDCARCHVEHRGPKYAFIPLDRGSFDHGMKTGFALEGRHRQLKCENCHTASNIAPGARSEIKIKDLNRSFLGLRPNCGFCHREPHQNQLGSDCGTCHTYEAWKPALRFDHSRAAFTLAGLHQKVSCEQCHKQLREMNTSEVNIQSASAEKGSNQKIILFKGLSFRGGCQDCHADLHQGSYQAIREGSKCADCHNAGGWKINRPGTGFDHSLTPFRLNGRHVALSCRKCHKDGNFWRPIAHEQCRNCHQNRHARQFPFDTAKYDCSACHSIADFKPALFNRETHSAFPLIGKHAMVHCEKCHLPGNREDSVRSGKRYCLDCHSGPHGDEFVGEPYNNRCDQCHTVAGFENTTFSRERHLLTRFPLTGVHLNVACNRCHNPPKTASEKTSSKMEPASYTVLSPPGSGRIGTANANWKFRFESFVCEKCHTDPHGLNAQSNLSCSRCHTTQEWKQPQAFDHSSSNAKLEGPHLAAAESMPCGKCHKPEGPSSGTIPMFSGPMLRCSGCHIDIDPHGGQFNVYEKGQKDCSLCHNPTAWSSLRFDHNNTRFVLAGAHATSECTKCHKDSELEGRRIRMYRDTPIDCLKCH